MTEAIQAVGPGHYTFFNPESDFESTAGIAESSTSWRSVIKYRKLEARIEIAVELRRTI